MKKLKQQHRKKSVMALRLLVVGIIIYSALLAGCQTQHAVPSKQGASYHRVYVDAFGGYARS